MKDKVKWILTSIMILALIILCKKTQDYIASSNTVGNKIVVIDAGHGGDDPGKVGVSGELEKDINLQIAAKVQKLLEAEDITVVMTREDEQGLYDDTASNKKRADMEKRVQLINQTNSEVVVSIHQNSFSDATVRGPQVFYHIESEEGQQFARVMQEELWLAAPEHKRQIKGNNSYYILKYKKYPLLLWSVAF